MSKSNVCKVLLSVFLVFPLGTGTHSQAVQTVAHKIFYFIDADCENCSMSDHKDAKIWIATSAIQSADMDDHDALLKKFRDVLINKYNADSTLLSRAVFRYQDSENQAAESYNAKETKMKGRGYIVIKIEL